MSTHAPRALTPAEERWNARTHGAGALLAVVAATGLLMRAVASGQTLQIASVGIFGATLVFTYLASTVYHSVTGEVARRRARRADHVGIYLLTAGTYTPFALVALGGDRGWLLFGLIWAMTLLGVGLEVAWLSRPRWLNALVFIALGWVAVFFLRPLAAALPGAALHWLLAGGVIYTLGTVFYVWRSLPQHHAIWHAWVVAGSACHVAAIALFIG